MKNNAKRIFALALVFIMCFCSTALGSENNTFFLRIEGAYDTVFSGYADVSPDGILWTALKQVMDENGIDYDASVGEGDVFINAVNGEKTGMFEWLDGWMYMVNGVSPTECISSCHIKAGDEVILYYGDMLDTLEPVVDVSSVKGENGYDVTIFVQGKRNKLDNNWDVIGYEFEPIDEALVTFDGVDYTADDDGIVVINGVKKGTHTYSVRKDDEENESYAYIIRTGIETMYCGVVTCTPTENGYKVNVEASDRENISFIYSLTTFGKPDSCVSKKIDLSKGYSEAISVKKGQTLWVNVLEDVDIANGKIGNPVGYAAVTK